MLDDSGRSKRVNLIFLNNEKMKRGLLLVENKHKKKVTFLHEQVITHAYIKRLPIEIKFSQQNMEVTVQGYIFHIDRRNKKVLLISGKNGHTKLCTPIPFAHIINAKIIQTKLQ